MNIKKKKKSEVQNMDVASWLGCVFFSICFLCGDFVLLCPPLLLSFSLIGPILRTPSISIRRWVHISSFWVPLTAQNERIMTSEISRLCHHQTWPTIRWKPWTKLRSDRLILRLKSVKRVWYIKWPKLINLNVSSSFISRNQDLNHPVSNF